MENRKEKMTKLKDQDRRINNEILGIPDSEIREVKEKKLSKKEFNKFPASKDYVSRLMYMPRRYKIIQYSCKVIGLHLTKYTCIYH